ncbi:MAG: tryptophan synthase subunit alpha [Bacteroidota bacterium]
MTETVTQRLQACLREKENILSIYFTAGYPALEDTRPILRHLQKAGADMVELGMPYSDPLADGPTIQECGSQAIANGMGIAKLFTQLEGFRSEIDLPVILMGYFNPIVQYGLEAFCAACQRVGIDGLIIPDLPLDYYQSHVKAVMEAAGLSMIFLISPSTSEERIAEIDAESSSFIYAVSSNSTTGHQSKHSASDYLKRLKAMNLKHPHLVGFNIRNKASFDAACAHAQGGIIGSAFLKALEPNNLKESIHTFIQNIRS